MTTITAPSGLVPLQAPLPSPRQFDLLAAANVIEPDSSRWLGGGWIGGDAPGPAHTHDPCSSGTQRVKALSDDIPTQMSGRFTVYKTGFCTAQSVGPDPKFWTDRMSLWFQVLEGAAVERALATGDGHSTLGSYLGDPNMETLGGGAVSSLRAMELLETEIAENGTGMIHAAPATATAWASDTLIAPKGGKMYTTLGTPVAVGAGYIGAIPDGKSAAADEEWAFASGPIDIYRAADPEVVPTNYFEAVDRSTNDVLFIAERPYLLSWIARQDPSDDGHIQAGVLIDLQP